MTTFSILIPSYKEKERLYKLVATILKDKFRNKIKNIVIVTPDKNIILPKSKKIIVIKERKRKGKYSAIGLGLKKINTKIVVLLSSDLKIRKNFLIYLIKPLINPKVGMVVGRPIADKNSKVYPLSKIIWDLHHFLCLEKPKGTEICAFRKIFNYFPKVSADEVFIEYKIRKAGYKIIYIPEAYGYTKIPNSLILFFKQRKRISVGHFNLKKKYSFSTSSLELTILIKALIKLIKNIKGLRNLLFLIFVIFLETLARIIAFFEVYLLGIDELVWKK